MSDLASNDFNQGLTEGPKRQRPYDQQAALMPNFKEYQEQTDLDRHLSA